MRDQCVEERCFIFFVLIVPFAGTLPQVIEQSLFLFFGNDSFGEVREPRLLLGGSRKSFSPAPFFRKLTLFASVSPYFERTYRTTSPNQFFYPGTLIILGI